MTDDLISRQAAIDAVKKNTFRLTFAEEQNCEGHVAWSAEAVYSDVMEGALLELPSAQPEPKEGHWILRESPDGDEQYECSECGVLWEFIDGTPEDNEAYFCPHCGAKMDEEVEGRKK